MPSMLHEALVMVFRDCPALAAKLLRGVLGVEVPTFARVRIDAADLGDVAPPEHRADLVLVFEDKHRRAVLAVVLEAQASPDKQKRLAWPVYVTSARARHNCPTLLFVVATTRALAAFCGKPIAVGHPGFVLRPIVLGPNLIPILADEIEARNAPELAVLSALAHSRGPHGREVVYAALAAADGLDADRARRYFDVVVGSLGNAARMLLEDMMQRGKYVFQSDFAKHYIALGEAQGEARGKAVGEARGIVAVLEARRIAVSDVERARILGCADLAALDCWLERAKSVGAVSELFD